MPVGQEKCGQWPSAEELSKLWYRKDLIQIWAKYCVPISLSESWFAHHLDCVTQSWGQYGDNYAIFWWPMSRGCDTQLSEVSTYNTWKDDPDWAFQNTKVINFNIFYDVLRSPHIWVVVVNFAMAQTNNNSKWNWYSIHAGGTGNPRLYNCNWWTGTISIWNE